MSITYQEAIAYSHNYATAQLGIGRTEREHIFGLCKVLEKVGEEATTDWVRARAGELRRQAEQADTAGEDE